MRIGRLIGRTVIGTLFVGHGAQKLFGSFGGHGIDGTGQFFEQLGLRPGRRNSIAAGASEAGGGALLVAGLLTPIAATALIGTMITAIRTVHLKNGPWSSNGGYEYNLVLIGALLAIVDGGPGALSLDRALGLDDTGAGWTLAALAAGALGSTAVIEAGRRYPAAESPSANGSEPAARAEPADEAQATTTA
jgi:putative oxidoreductase